MIVLKIELVTMNVGASLFSNYTSTVLQYVNISI